MKSIAVFSALLICAASSAADLHPIVEVQTGYLFGATGDGKRMKAEEAAKALNDEIGYRIYGLTQMFGEARGWQAETVTRGCVFGYADGFVLAEAGQRRDRVGRAMECAAAKAASDRSNATSLCRCGA